MGTQKKSPWMYGWFCWFTDRRPLRYPDPIWPGQRMWHRGLVSWKRVVIPPLIVLMAGCAVAGTSSFSRVPASPTQVQNEVLIDKPFEETWDQLVKGLAKSFYVINNIEKASRIINVSFSTESPEQFIDCGKSKCTYERGNDRQEYVYDIASSSSYRIADKAGAYGQFPVTHHLNRATSLEGRVNIYMAPKGDKTVVSVNSRYIFTVRVSGNSVVENAYGTPVNYLPIPSSSRNLSFNTNQQVSVDLGSPQAPDYVTCYSTGKLEGDILNLVR